jgi:hypothetical protein
VSRLARRSPADVMRTVETGAPKEPSRFRLSRVWQLDSDTGSGDETVTVPSDAIGDYHLDVSTGSGDLSVTEG